MASRTLKELRAEARSLGLRGYSRLSRAELEKLLSRKIAQKSAIATKPVSATGVSRQRRTKKSGREAILRGRSAATPIQPAKPEVPKADPAPAWSWQSENDQPVIAEEQVERSKYATGLPGNATLRGPATDLGEDIDALPPITEPALCLLPQKPGVLHGYWMLPSNLAPSGRTLKLRFGRKVRETLEVLQEITLPQTKDGRWYFHMNEAAHTGELYLQLGYYEPDGRFVTAIRRGIARVPSLYASDQTDRLWWVSEEQFRAMYRRAGGAMHGPRYGWAGSIGSPGGAPGAPASDRLAWPGQAVTSR